jgi:GNAT superfamily N-acetyltransferase
MLRGMKPYTKKQLDGHPVLSYADGSRILSAADAAEVLSQALGERAAWVLLPQAVLDPKFFELRSGLAGEVVQKFANYGVSLAILGDLSAQASKSEALRAFIVESNRGTQLWFVADAREFETRLTRRAPPPDDNTGYRVRRAERLSPKEIDGLAEVLIDCVEGGASVSFMQPMTPEKAQRFWTEVAASTARGERQVFIAEDADGILGTVQLVSAQPENQPHRADIAKMLVHRRARRRGVGAALLKAAEAGARAHGKTLLVLDTVTGSEGYRLYSAHGWQRVGEIPDYALWPNGELCSTTYFYKSLR